jgi:cation diffusion facilitator CzcD-associated flavoprotein CzcO
MDHGVSFGGEVSYEYLVLGAGPAGLQMGHHLSRAGHSYLILEAGDSPGTFFKRYPRHRTLASRNKVHTGSGDPEIRLRFDECSLLDEDGGSFRFNAFSRRYLPDADEMVSYLCAYAEHHELNVRCNTRVLRVEKPGPNLFRLIDAAGNVFSCRRLIVATGTARPRVPAVPGIDQAESYAEVSIDPEDFVNQRVLVIGRGSAAAETAQSLIPTAALVHTLPERAVEQIDRREGQLVVAVRASGETGERVYDRVIVAAGFRFDDSIFASGCRPELARESRLPVRTAEWESINVPGLYFAGALARTDEAEDHPSGAIHGFRYSTRALFRILEAKYHRRAWPAREIEPTPEGLVEATLARLSRASAPWQQPGFLHDVIVVEEGWSGASYREEMPLAYLHRSALGESGHYYTVTLERGPAGADPFETADTPEPAWMEESAALHPVIRRWSGGQLISEKHLPEDPYAEWKKPEAHVAPLRYFFMQQLLEIAESADYQGRVELEPRRRLRVV